jgi:hypothetical protein
VFFPEAQWSGYRDLGWQAEDWMKVARTTSCVRAVSVSIGRGTAVRGVRAKHQCLDFVVRWTLQEP